MQPIDDGLHRIVVDASVNDGTKACKLMSHFLEPDFDDADFPETSKQIKFFKHTEEGEKIMSEVMRRITLDYTNRALEIDRAKQRLAQIQEVADAFHMPIALVYERLGLSINDVQKLRDIASQELGQP